MGATLALTHFCVFLTSVALGASGNNIGLNDDHCVVTLVVNLALQQQEQLQQIQRLRDKVDANQEWTSAELAKLSTAQSQQEKKLQEQSDAVHSLQDIVKSMKDSLELIANNVVALNETRSEQDKVGKVVVEKLADLQSFQDRLDAVEMHHTASEADMTGALSEQFRQIDNLKLTMLSLDAGLNWTRGNLTALKNTGAKSESSFVRWGRTVCPNETTLIYSGYVAGSNWTNPGGGANYLCSTKEPVYDDTTPLGSHSMLYGVEYWVPGHKYTDAQCAVCLARRAATYMLPGTNRCPEGSVAQYRGYLVAKAYKQAPPTQYICLDEAPEERNTSSENEHSGYLENVLSHCGALPCPPYVQGKVMTCVVCSV